MTLVNSFIHNTFSVTSVMSDDLNASVEAPEELYVNLTTIGLNSKERGIDDLDATSRKTSGMKAITKPFIKILLLEFCQFISLAQISKVLF